MYYHVSYKEALLKRIKRLFLNLDNQLLEKYNANNNNNKEKKKEYIDLHEKSLRKKKHGQMMDNFSILKLVTKGERVDFFSL